MGFKPREDAKAMRLAFVLLDSQCTHEQCRLLVPTICARGSGQAVTLASKTNAVNQAAVLHIPCPRVISSYASHNGPAVSAYCAPLGDVEVHKTKLPPPKAMGFNLLFACGRGEFRVLLSRCVDHSPPSGASPGLLVLLSVYCRCFFYPFRGFIVSACPPCFSFPSSVHTSEVFGLIREAWRLSRRFSVY